MKKTMAMILSLALLLCACAAWAEGDVPSLEALAGLEWSFSSGAGAWSTDLRLSADGSFAGEYHDSEMSEAADEYPNGTVYCCAFTGRMSLVKMADDGAWAVRVDSLTLEKATGEESVDEGIRFVTTEPYGIREGDELRLFRPGTPVDALTEDMRIWAHVLGEDAPETLETWFMYGEQSESGFVGIPAAQVSMANP